MRELLEELTSHLRSIWRSRWWGVAAAWVIAVGGWVYVYAMPDRYEVETQVYLDNRSVLQPLLAGITVESDLDEVAAMVSGTLLIRPNLEEVIRLVQTDSGIAIAGDREQMLGRLARDISVTGVGRENVYVISFAHENPSLAKAVVDALLKVFVQRSLSDNRQDSDSAQEFIDQQLDHYRSKLEAAENAMITFKRKNLTVLPGAGARYFDRIVESKEAVRQAELDLREAEDSANSIRNQLAIASRNAALPTDEGGPASVEPGSETETELRIRALQQRLDELRLSYTEQHPDIVAARSMMEELRKRKGAEDEDARRIREKREADALSRDGGQSTYGQATDPVVQELTVSLAAADANVAAMRTRYTEYSRRYDELQAAANAVPQVEAEFTQLTRDYEVTRARYDELLQRRETALISENLESGNATIGFRVIAPPRMPSRPSEPDRPGLMTMTLLAALFGGVGIAWVMGQMKSGIDSESKLRTVSGSIPVLGTVVMARTDEQVRRRKWGWFGLATSMAGLISVYAVIILTLASTFSRA